MFVIIMRAVLILGCFVTSCFGAKRIQLEPNGIDMVQVESNSGSSPHITNYGNSPISLYGEKDRGGLLSYRNELTHRSPYNVKEDTSQKRTYATILPDRDLYAEYISKHRKQSQKEQQQGGANRQHKALRIVPKVLTNHHQIPLQRDDSQSASKDVHHTYIAHPMTNQHEQLLNQRPILRNMELKHLLGDHTSNYLPTSTYITTQSHINSISIPWQYDSLSQLLSGPSQEVLFTGTHSSPEDYLRAHYVQGFLHSPILSIPNQIDSTHQMEEATVSSGNERGQSNGQDSTRYYMFATSKNPSLNVNLYKPLYSTHTRTNTDGKHTEVSNGQQQHSTYVVDHQQDLKLPNSISTLNYDSSGQNGLHNEPKSLLDSYTPSAIIAAQDPMRYREKPLSLKTQSLSSTPDLHHLYK